MEKRIKLLYIITIVAILAFLGMQVYWLLGRYEFALGEYERNLAGRIMKCVDQYNTIRANSTDAEQYPSDMKQKEEIIIPRFFLHQHYDDSVTTIRTSRILIYNISAHDLLGLEPGTPLTEEMKNRAMDLVQLQEASDSVTYDASGARDENEAWTATRNVYTERKNPFTVNGIDSVMGKAGIKAEVSLAKADTMVWRPTEEYHHSLLNPGISMTIPYSQLEGQTVNVVCAINPFDILPEMWSTLLISLVVSALLIVCLVMQFATVLRLSRLDRLRNSFITTMIHELNRPISTLKMCVSGLDNDRMLDDADIRREMTGASRTALDNLSAYFSKLRDLTFNNVEQIPLNIQNINLHSLIDAVSSALVVPAGKKVAFQNGIGKEIEVSADRSHLYNIINNLMDNAIKYSGQSVEIKAEATADNDTVRIQISDNGNGIASGDLRHVFTRFYRGKAAAGDQPGMGLGLTYVKLLVEAHGGEISVGSREGEGTCFTIKLPQ